MRFDCKCTVGVCVGGNHIHHRRRPQRTDRRLPEPGVFFTGPGDQGRQLVMLRLAEVDAGRLEELVTDAWRMRAPGAAG